MNKKNTKESVKHNLRNSKLTVAIVSGIIILLLLVFAGIHIYFSGSYDVNSLASKVFESQVSLSKIKKLNDISISPYSFDYFDVFPKNNTQENSAVGHGVYINVDRKGNISFKDFVLGTSGNIKMVAFFDKDGIYKGTFLVHPRTVPEKDFEEMLKTANEKDYKYLILHTGFFYNTKNKVVLEAERKISNACILMLAKFKGKQALYSILPPPGKNASEQLVNFIKSLRVQDASGHIVDFSKFNRDKIMIVTVNPYCGSCLDNFMNFVISVPRNMELDRFIVISSGESEKVKNIFDKFEENSDVRCNLIVDKNRSLIGQGRFGLGELIMFDKGFKLYFKGPIGELLRDRKTMNKVFRWQSYARNPGYGEGNQGGNTNP